MQAPERTGCEPLPDQRLTYQLTIDGNTTTHTETQVELLVEAYTNYSIEVKAINSQDMESMVTSRSLLTMSTGKD